MKRVLLFLLLLTSFTITHAQVAQSIELSGTWKVTWNEGGHGPQSLDSYLQSVPSKDPARFLDVPVHMELHLALQKAGLVEDINYGMNTLKARWVAEKYWLYVRTFTVPDGARKQSPFSQRYMFGAPVLIQKEKRIFRTIVLTCCRGYPIPYPGLEKKPLS